MPLGNGRRQVSLCQFCPSFSLIQSPLHALAFFTEKGVFFRECRCKMGVDIVSEL